MKKCSILFLIILLFALAGTKAFADCCYVLPRGKTLFADVEDGCSLESENSQIAQVNGSLITARALGNAKIIIKQKEQQVGTINITVCKPGGIKCCYTSPNIVKVGGRATLRAITDDSVTAVKFFVNEGGTTREIAAQNKEKDAHNFIFSCDFVAKTPGKHEVFAKFLQNGSWRNSNESKTDLYVSSGAKNSQAEHRASDNCISYIARKEGFRGSCMLDGLSRRTYDIGHGETVNKGQIFYNNITRSEARAKLVNTLNSGVFARAVNNLLAKNNVNCTQNQFDALLSFSYNLGPGWTYGSKLRDIILRAGALKSELKGRVTAPEGLNLRAEPNSGAKKFLAMKCGEEVDIKSDQRYNENWVKVCTKGGLEGYCCADYLTINMVGVGKKDLSFVDKDAFVNEFLQYHHAAQKCYRGLLYRRIEELQMFFNGDFSDDGSQNKCKFPVPRCIQQF